MSFDELLTQLRKRVDDFARSLNAAVVLGDGPLNEATQLSDALALPRPEPFTLEDQQNTTQALRTLGWFYYLRFAAVPANPDDLDLLRSLRFAIPLASNPELIPAALHVFLGPAATSDVQAHTACGLLGRAMNSSEPVLLDVAIGLLTVALGSTTDEHPERAFRLSNLGAAYRLRFEQRGTAADLEQAIRYGEEAVSTAIADPADRGAHLSNLASAYQTKFGHTADPATIDQAIELYLRALNDTPTSHINYAAMLHNLSGAFQIRFGHMGDDLDLDHAIDYGEQAVKATSPDDSRRAVMVSNLGSAYRLRFQRTIDARNLDRMIEYGKESISATPRDHPDYPVMLSNLAGAYQTRSAETGSVSDLDHAITHGEATIEATPAESPRRAPMLSNLSGAYETRFGRAGIGQDIDRAIDYGLAAVTASTGTDPGLPERLSNLGDAYRSRFGRLGEVQDLNEAIRYGTQAVDTTHPNQPSRATLLSNLGASHLTRYQHTEVADDLNQAIERGEQAVTSAGPVHAKRAMFLSNLAAAYSVRFRHAKNHGDLDLAITHATKAVAATPGDHPKRAAMLSLLGNGHHVRYAEGLGRPDHDLMQALARDVGMTPTSPPSDRVKAGFIVGELAHALDENEVAVKLLDNAVGLLPSVPPRESGWADWEHSLGRHSGLITEAVAAHCAMEDPAGAVRIAEHGRAVLQAAQLDSRSDLTDLEDVDSKLAGQFREIRERLDSSPVNDKASVEERRRWWAEYDVVLGEIRKLDGFKEFLLPPKIADLTQAATGGAVVLVNTGRRRSDAVIITPDSDPHLVRLPLLDIDSLISHLTTLYYATNPRNDEERAGAPNAVTKVLGWLWRCVVGPILDELAEISPGGQLPERVWWMPTGLLAMMPLHAAGRPHTDGTLDVITSSYTPTLRALARARSRPPATHRRHLVVALEHTPSRPDRPALRDLPGTVAEAANLHARHPDTPPLLDHEATSTNVLAGLPQATWAHFACHADIDVTAPSRGGLLLADQDLLLPAISGLRLAHAELAYLSACHGAAPSWRHADEALHLSSAFQLAGFRHVIASLWPLNDHVAAVAAHIFYNELSDSVTADAAAQALHHVVHELRGRYPDNPQLWATLIHTGP